MVAIAKAIDQNYVIRELNVGPTHELSLKLILYE
jgi:hypothetical protein